MQEPFITLHDITIRLRDRFILPHTSWKIRTDENWVILGPNGAGKSSLVRVLAGDVPYVGRKVTYHFQEHPSDVIGFVSSELQEQLIAADRFQDMSRYFAGRPDEGLTARATILSGAYDGDCGIHELPAIADTLGIRHLLDRGIRCLSSGEMRKVVIARALIKSPKLLVLDEPFSGIDSESRERIAETLSLLVARGLRMVLVTHRPQEIPPFVSHVLMVKEGEVVTKGARPDVLTPANLNHLYGVKRPVQVADERRPWSIRDASQNGRIIVDMRNVCVRYGDVPVLNDINWVVRRGENWAILGPCGSGKSTLLSLIAGDNPQAYANEIYLFGKRRGSGESIWEIKERIGAVSSEVQTVYRKDMKVRDVVASGLFDSIGLYRNLSSEYQELVARWIEFFSISHMADRIFTHLSFGERRIVLLARAMVKSPELLILDEPCQGLDRENRKFFMGMIETIGRVTETNLLYVTHYRDELPACIDRVLELKRIDS